MVIGVMMVTDQIVGG